MNKGLFKSIVVLFFIVFIGYLVQASVAPKSTKIGVSIRNLMGGEAPLPVLVILKAQADLSFVDLNAPKEIRGQQVYDALRKVALDSQQELVDLFTKKGIFFQRFYIMNMIALDQATPELIEELAARPDVDKIIGNPTLKNHFLPRQRFPKTARIENGVEPNITSVGATKVWQEFKVTGQGIVVGNQDTGMQWDHPALKPHYRGYTEKDVDHKYSWHDAIHKPLANGTNPCGFDVKAPCDDDEHGTHTTGTIVGDDGGANKTGMAPGAQWIGCRNMDRGVGRPTTYLECFEFFLAPYPQGGNPLTEGVPSKAPHVINNSWGCPPSEGCQGAELLPVIEALNLAGLMVVVSAGNSGSSCSSIIDPPAHFTLATLSVGALDHRNGNIAYFSSRGPSKFDNGLGPDIAAPGVGIRSSIPGNNYSDTFMWSGTSMAGPHVVGQVALMWSAKPALIGKVLETGDIIRKTASPKTSSQTCGGVSGSTVPNNTYGYGYIDAYSAVKSLFPVK